MGRRRDQRRNISLRVRVFGTDAQGKPFVRLAHTVDVSASGARIGGIHLALKPGDIVGVQRGSDKARFRVAWVGKTGTRSAGELGLFSLEPQKEIWGFHIPGGEKDDYEPKASFAERRTHSRWDCDLGVELRTDPDAPSMLVRCTDISHGGCYLETWSPLPIGVTVYLSAKLPTGTLRMMGQVRTLDPAFGMGIAFTQVAPIDELDNLLERLQPASAPNPTPAGTNHRSADIASLGSQPDRDHADLVPAYECIEVRQPSVLLAEDSRFLRSAYALYLRREGFQIIAANDGYEALEFATADHPDVIVLDLLMPKLGGVGALKALKEDPATAHIPVIVLSGLPSSNESKLISCGAFAYLAKTQVGPEDLPQYVRRALHSRHSQPGGAFVPTNGSQPHHIAP